MHRQGWRVGSKSEGVGGHIFYDSPTTCECELIAPLRGYGGMLPYMKFLDILYS